MPHAVRALIGHPAGVALGLAATLALQACTWSSTCSFTTITTASLPEATVGERYAFTLTHNCSGREAASWEVMTGELPPGIELAWDGRLFGAPTTAGHFSFQVSLSLTSRDWGATVVPSGSDSRNYTLTVRP
jgi:hypothetical protein